MTEVNGEYTSVLLPAARVALFSRDEDTVTAFKALEEDWRFARVILDVHEGDVDTATSFFEAHEAPDLIIVQTDDIDDGFSDRLEGLAAHCDEDTAAIVIGPVNDVDLYRKLVGMGVSDYLVRPLESKFLGDNIAATLIDKKGFSGSCVIAVMGVKGGVGTSVIAQTVARGLAGDYGQKTFLMDAAGGWSTLGVGMDFEPSTTLIEASKAAASGKTESLVRMMFTASDKLTILSSGGDVMLDDSVAPDGYEALLEHLMTLYPFIVVDLSASPSPLKRIVLSRARRVLVVASPCLNAVRATRTLCNEIKELRGGEQDATRLILNMKGFASKAEVPTAQIEEGVEQHIAATVPFLPDLFVERESAGQALSSHKDGQAIAQSLLSLVSDLVGPRGEGKSDAKKADKGAVGSLLQKLMTKT